MRRGLGLGLVFLVLLPLSVGWLPSIVPACCRTGESCPMKGKPAAMTAHCVTMANGPAPQVQACRGHLTSPAMVAVVPAPTLAPPQGKLRLTYSPQPGRFTAWQRVASRAGFHLLPDHPPRNAA